MNFLKSVLRGFVSIIFKLSVVSLVVFGSLVMVFGTSKQLKQSLKDSKMYEEAGANSIVDSIGKPDEDNKNQQPQVPQNQEDDSLFSDPGVKAAAKTALTPTFLQSASEQIIDGTYGWLQGKTAKPEFRVDATSVKQQFTAAVGDYAVSRAKSLPVCTKQQLIAMSSNTKIDALKATCIPPGFAIEGLRAQVAAELDKADQEKDSAKKQNPLQDPILTADKLTVDKEDGPSIVPKHPLVPFYEQDQLKKAPQIFHLVTLLPLLFGGLAVVSGGLVVLLHDDKRRGLRKLAIPVVSVGILTLTGIFLTHIVFNKLQEPGGPFSKIDGNIKEPITALISSITSAINHSLMLFGIVYVVMGVGTLIALSVTKPKQPEEHEPTMHHPEPPEEQAKEASEAQPSTSAKADSATTKPKKSDKKLIQ